MFSKWGENAKAATTLLFILGLGITLVTASNVKDEARQLRDMRELDHMAIMAIVRQLSPDTPENEKLLKEIEGIYNGTRP